MLPANHSAMPRFDVVESVLDRVTQQTDFPPHFVVVYGGMGVNPIFRFVIGLEHDPADDPDRLRSRLEAAFPGEVAVRVMPRRAWEMGAIELDEVLLEAFQQGRTLLDGGDWANILAHFQQLADRGLIVKTRLGWRRPGDAPRDPDAELFAHLFNEMKRSRRGR